MIATHRFVPPFVGGVDVYADRLGRALQRLGHEVSVLAFDSTASSHGHRITVTQDVHGGTQIWRLLFSFADRPKEAFDHSYDGELGDYARQILNTQKPALLIIMNFYLLTFAVVGAAKELGIPVAHVATDFLPVCRRGTFMQWNGQVCQTGESAKSCAACFVSHRLPGRVASRLLNVLPETTLSTWADDTLDNTGIHPLRLLKPYWKQFSLSRERLAKIRTLRKSIDIVLAPARFTMQTFIDNGFERSQVHFLQYGIEPDDPLVTTKYVPAAHTRFLFVGRLQPYKGAHLLIEAFKRLERPRGAVLTIYGVADRHDDYLEQLKKSTEDNENVRFLGGIAHDNLAAAFAETDYFVLPSTWNENCPFTLLESFQARTPVIASNVAGVTDLVQEGVNGFLFEVGNVKSLQEVMQRVIDQPLLRNQLIPDQNLLDIDSYTQTLLGLFHKQLSPA